MREMVNAGSRARCGSGMQDDAPGLFEILPTAVQNEVPLSYPNHAHTRPLLSSTLSNTPKYGDAIVVPETLWLPRTSVELPASFHHDTDPA